MPRKKITETALRQFKTKPPAKRTELTDQRCPSLVVRANPSGKVTFTVAFRPPGRTTKRVTLGDWPDLTINQARDEADRIVDSAKAYIFDDSIFDTTVGTLWTKYVDEHLSRTASRSWDQLDKVFKKYVLPEHGDKELRVITFKLINERIRTVVKDVGIGAARHVRSLYSGFLNWGVREGYIPANPIAGQRFPELAPNMNAGTEASDLQIRYLYRAAKRMHQLGSQYGKCLQLIMLTGIRRANWGIAKREWLDLENRWMVIPHDYQKSKRDELVPLSDQAMKVIEDIPTWAGPYLFSKRGESGYEGLTAFSKPARWQRALANEMYQADINNETLELAPLRIHDFKVTLGSRLARLGVAPEIRSALLQHSRGRLTQIYEKYDYLSEKREAMQLYANHLMEIVDGK